MNKIVNFKSQEPKTLADWCRKFSSDYKMFTRLIVEGEIPGLESQLEMWKDYKFEFPYIGPREGNKLGAFEIVSSQIIGLHLNFTIRALREYEDLLNHINNFDFHDMAISLRRIIELDMMNFYITHRLEKAIIANDIKTILSIVFRTAYATKDKVLNPNDLTRFFTNKFEKLGLKKEKIFHINDAFDYYWKNSTNINVNLLDSSGKIIKEEIWELGGKGKSENHKKNFQEFYNFLSEEVHPVGILSRLPYRENFYEEDIQKGVSDYFKNLKIENWNYGSSDKEYKIFWFSFYLFRNVSIIESSNLSRKLFYLHNYNFNQLDVKNFDNTVKNLLGEKLILDCNKKISEEFMKEEFDKIKKEYGINWEI